MAHWKQLLRTWKFQPAMQLATLSVLVGVFTILTMSYSIHKNMQRVLLQWSESVRMTVYLKEAEGANNSEIEKFLQGTGHFAEVKFVSKNDAAKQFMERMGRFVPDLFSDPNFENPLPASYELQLKAGLTTSGLYDELLDIVKQISTRPGVEEVSFGQGWIENYAGVLRAFSRGSWFLVLLLLAGSLLIIGNAIRSSVVQRRDEIEVLELVGATATSIRAPFIFEGLIMGLMASACSVIVGYGIYLWQANLVREGLGFLGVTRALVYLSPLEIIYLLVGGALFGALGSYLCVKPLASGWAAAGRNG